MRVFQKRDEGFTLVELMVVILIIGILVAIAIPVFNAARATAQERTCHANQRTIEGAVQQVVATGNIQPTAVTLPMILGDADIPGADPLRQEFIAQNPVCPTNNVEPYVLTNGQTTCPDATTPHGRFQ
ncbi:MAG: prepilin-type N-terminal cleavage/methylation domain-containing protein [Clostridiales bacterium]|nr:prepilin-type N-terminal cleavage/methylation domain-containing protein [Clostridiales bacterium]